MVRGDLLAGFLLAGSLSLISGPAHAGSVTSESIFSVQATRQRAMEQVPRSATVTRTDCQDLEVVGSTRYRCTVFYTTAPAAPAPAAPAPAKAAPFPP